MFLPPTKGFKGAAAIIHDLMEGGWGGNSVLPLFAHELNGMDRLAEDDYGYSRFGQALKNAVHSFKDSKTSEDNLPEHEEFWTLSVYFFLCYTHDIAVKGNDLQEERDWIGSRLCALQDKFNRPSPEVHIRCMGDLWGYSRNAEFVRSLYDCLFREANAPQRPENHSND